MKKFVIRIVYFLSLVTTTFYVLIQLKPFPYVQEFIKIEDSYDIINFGTSHGGAFNYSSLNIKGESFNIPSNTMYYDFQNYKYLKPYLNEGAVILIPLSYFSFGLDENRTDRGEINPFVDGFYGYLPRKAIYGFTYRKMMSAYQNRIRNNFFSSFVFLPRKNRRQPILFLETKAEIEHHAIKRASHHMAIGTYIGPEKNLKYLSSLIEDSLKSGFCPVLVTTPYHDSYNAGFDEQWLEDNYYRHINVLITKYEIPYLDYSKHSSITNNYQLFQNSDHLNHKGSLYFSNMFFQDLRALGIIYE